MRATTAAAAALLLGSVSADWESWSTSASTDPVADTTYSEPSDPSVSTVTDDSSTWSAWDPTTTTEVDPSTWSEWDTTSSTPAAETSTSTDPDYTWSEWSSSSTTSEDPSTWSEWESTTSSTPAAETSTATDPAYTWSEWASTTSSSTPVDPASTWSAWDPSETVTSTSTQWITVTVMAADGGHTWSEWSSDPATAKSTKTNTNTVVVSSTITKTATSSAQTWGSWSSGAAPVAAVVDPLCHLEISVSYGAPIWYPTPVIATSANSTAWGEWESTTAASTSTDPAQTWSEWASTSSTPAAKTSTSTDPADTWSEWQSFTSSTPAAKTSTSTDPDHTWSEWASSSISTDPDYTWSEWQSSTSSTPASKTSTDPASSWAAWSSASQTQSSASSTASAGSNGGSWSTGGAGISANGNKFGMTYSPYTASGDCKDQGTVSADIAIIAGKGFTSVRVYSTDCSTLEFVGSAAKQNGIKIILGVFISDTGISGAQPQVDAIATWAQWDLVELIVVGNEAVFNSRCSASDLAGFIGSAKGSFQAAGFKGAVSTTDELSVWQGQGSAWCDVVDVVTANLYAFFNADTAAEDAGDFIQRQIQDLSAVCPGKEVYVMESGWPSAGDCFGKACPSPENQATAIKGIQQTSGAKVVFFSYEDEQWKQPGQFGVEQHWGCGSVFD